MVETAAIVVKTILTDAKFLTSASVSSTIVFEVMFTTGSKI